jgi:hypothetical protein
MLAQVLGAWTAPIQGEDGDAMVRLCPVVDRAEEVHDDNIDQENNPRRF